jgi:hypothetical protein
VVLAGHPDGSHPAKTTAATHEVLLLHPVVECHTSTHLSRVINSLVTTTVTKTSITRVVSITDTNKATRITAEAVEVVVVVAAADIVVTAAVVVDMVGTRN